MLQERDDIVALDSAILQHPRVWEASGHLAGLHRPARRSASASARSASAPTTSRHCECGDEAEQALPGECGGELTEPRQFNLMFETYVGPVQERAPRSTCAPRPRRASSSTSRTCSSSRARSRRSASPRSASRSATRSRPATSSSARASSSRWRWSSSCRPPRREQWYELLDGRARCAGTPTSASAPDHLRLRPHGADELSHYSSGDQRRRVPVPDRLVGARGDRQPRRLRPHRSTPSSRGEKLEYFDQARGERYVPHVIEPAAGADRATARLPGRRLRRGGGRGPRAHACCACTRGSRRSRSRCCRSCRKDGHAGEGARDLRGAAPRASRPSTTRAARSASATAARTRSARPGASRSTTRRWRTTPSPCATATRWSRSASTISQVGAYVAEQLAAPWQTPKSE